MGDDIPLTLQGLKNALVDFRDDYSSHIHDGTSTKTFQTIRAEAASLRALSIQKIGYGDSTPGLWAGVVNGASQFNLGNASNYIKWDGTSLSILGGVTISYLDIPDTTTANSFHVDVNGNTWWGANVASGLSNANASVSNTGAAIFKNVQIGGSTIQYVITNSGIFSFGDGSDGTVTISTDTTLTRDMYYSSLTVNSAAILNPAGYRIFVSNTFTLSGNAKIQRNGNNGSNGVDSPGGSGQPPGGAGGAALADGYLKGSAAGGAGGNGDLSNPVPGSAGGNGAAVTNSLGTAGAAGGAGGIGSLGSRLAGGTAGAATASNVKLIANWHLATLLDISSSGSTVKFTNSGGAGGGGGGRTHNANSYGGSGGGAGSNGGIIAVYAKNIVINSGSSIVANGGNGGNGGKGFNGGSNTASSSGGGGAGAGTGGLVILVYNTYSNAGTITVNGGTKGTGGIGYDANENGQDGNDGSAGTIYTFQLSL